MPRDGSGAHTWPAGSTAVSSATIESAKYNGVLSDASSEITASLPRSGVAAMTGNLSMGGNIVTNLGAGTAVAPSLTITGAGAGTGLFGLNAGAGADFLAVTIDGVEAMRILDNGDLQIDSGNVIHRDVTDDSLTVSGGNAAAVGANAIFYGSTHATLAGDIALRDGSTNELYFDSSAAEWQFNNNSLVDVTDVFRGIDTDVLSLSGGTDGDTGINFRIFGGTHASQAGNFNIRTGTTNILRYDSALGDASQGRFEFNSKQIYNTSSVRLINYTVANAPSASTAGEGALIYTTNGDAGGRCLAVSNGAAWKRVVMGPTISAT